MSMSPETKKKLLANTRRAALAVAEDLEHIRSVIARLDQNRGEVRRISAILRRLLVEGTLQTVASPRIGRIAIEAADLRTIHRSVTKSNTSYFAAGNVQIFGLQIANLGSADEGAIPYVDPDARVSTNIDSFLSQKTVFYDGKWVTRREIIKFCANVDSGVHAGIAREESEKVLDDCRGRFQIAVSPEGNIRMFAPTDEIAKEKKTLAGNWIDIPSLEAFATARLVVESTDVRSLEKAIATEA